MWAVRVDQAVTRRTVLKGLAGVGLGAVAGAASHGFMYERHHLELTRASFPIAGLPEALRGLRVGFLSDIHRSQTVSHEAVAVAVQMVMAERPDLIVLGGDYVTWKDARFIGPAADALAPLRAPLGVIAVLGNHDDDRDMPAALAAKGFTVLRDARTRVTVRGEALDFVGIRYWTVPPAGHRASVARQRSPRDPAGSHTQTALRGAAARGVGRPQRPHPWRADRAALDRRRGGTGVPRRGRLRATRRNVDLRQPRRGHRVRAGPHQLSARGRRPHAGTLTRG